MPVQDVSCLIVDPQSCRAYGQKKAEPKKRGGRCCMPGLPPVGVDWQMGKGVNSVWRIPTVWWMEVCPSSTGVHLGGGLLIELDSGGDSSDSASHWWSIGAVFNCTLCMYYKVFPYNYNTKQTRNTKTDPDWDFVSFYNSRKGRCSQPKISLAWHATPPKNVTRLHGNTDCNGCDLLLFISAHTLLSHFLWDKQGLNQREVDWSGWLPDGRKFLERDARKHESGHQQEHEEMVEPLLQPFQRTDAQHLFILSLILFYKDGICTWRRK